MIYIKLWLAANFVILLWALSSHRWQCYVGQHDETRDFHNDCVRCRYCEYVRSL